MSMLGYGWTISPGMLARCAAMSRLASSRCGLHTCTCHMHMCMCMCMCMHMHMCMHMQNEQARPAHAAYMPRRVTCWRPRRRG